MYVSRKRNHFIAIMRTGTDQLLVGSVLVLFRVVHRRVDGLQAGRDHLDHII
jgi:hypothetical protein